MIKNILTNSRLLLGIGLLLVSMSSCNNFESEPLTSENEDSVWHNQDPSGNKAHAFLYGVYRQLPSMHDRISSSYLDSSTDDAVPSFDTGNWNSVNSFRNGGISAEQVVDNTWGINYYGIRRANVFLANIDDVYLKEELEPNRIQWKAEARFLRAFFYFELMKRWGGVPIIGDKIYKETDTIVLERNSVEETAQYILSELSIAEGDLLEASKLKDGELGRITNGVAKALRSRVLLYLASPLYNQSNDKEKWQAAADAAKEVIDLNYYQLKDDFKTIFTEFANNKELIFVAPSNKHTGLELRQSPVGFYYPNESRGQTSPSQNLVDAFLTINGLPIDKDANYNPESPYNLRDPRLSATVFHHGSRWLKRSVEVHEGGLDKPNTPNLPQTKTGYYLRKFLGNFEESDRYSGQQHGAIYIRYAEILLNYAEALNEVGFENNKEEIENVIFQLRKRAGIQAGQGRYGLSEKLSQEEMRSVIHNERRVELAFEEHRFWDLRRWKLAEVVLNQPVEGVQVIKLPDGTFSYSRIHIMDSSFDASRMYLYPIPISEIYSNTLLKQNPNWNY